ncbi:MAG: outer membrane lipoprotein-sorting protein [Bacteroidota bacterium]
MRSLLSSFALLLFVFPAQAQTSASDVFEEVERRQDLVDTESASIRMEIVDERGRTRTRALDLRSKTDGERLKSILVFTGPADIRGTGLLTVETDDGDDQKLYLPALGRVQRIAGSTRGERFAGSDFTYEDLGTRDPDAYDVTMAETTPDAFVLDARPTDGDSKYSRIVLTVDRARYVVLRAEHYDRGGALAKVLTAGDFAEVAPDAWRADTLTMEDVQAGRRTVLTYTERATGTALRDDLFSERQLQRGLR